MCTKIINDQLTDLFYNFIEMLYIFGCGLYTLYCQEWLQFLILLVAEFGCFALIFMGALIVDAAERFNGWVAGL